MISRIIFPITLILFGCSFFVNMDRQKIPVRVCIGLSLIFVAILCITSLCTPAIAVNRPQDLFLVDNAWYCWYRVDIGYGC